MEPKNFINPKAVDKFESALVNRKLEYARYMYTRFRFLPGSVD